MLMPCSRSSSQRRTHRCGGCWPTRSSRQCRSKSAGSIRKSLLCTSEVTHRKLCIERTSKRLRFFCRHSFRTLSHLAPHATLHRIQSGAPWARHQPHFHTENWLYSFSALSTSSWSFQPIILRYRLIAKKPCERHWPVVIALKPLREKKPEVGAKARRSLALQHDSKN